MCKYKFFQNKECEFFPCHSGCNEAEFNCLFCFCPLYYLREKCGGNFDFVGENKSIKDCSKCTFPHIAANYDAVIKKLSRGD